MPDAIADTDYTGVLCAIINELGQPRRRFARIIGAGIGYNSAASVADFSIAGRKIGNTKISPVNESI
jgi:hypothetical protein